MSERIDAIKKLVDQFPPGNLNRKLWVLVIAELEDLRHPGEQRIKRCSYRFSGSGNQCQRDEHSDSHHSWKQAAEPK
jgi:hypothetical protein